MMLLTRMVLIFIALTQSALADLCEYSSIVDVTSKSFSSNPTETKQYLTLLGFKQNTNSKNIAYISNKAHESLLSVLNPGRSLMDLIWMDHSGNMSVNQSIVVKNEQDELVAKYKRKYHYYVLGNLVTWIEYYDQSPFKTIEKNCEN